MSEIEADAGNDRPRPVHQPVLLDEVLEALALAPGKTVVDGTVGAGGHAAAVARAVLPGGRVIGLDRDPEMLELARTATEGLPVELFRSSYSDLKRLLMDEGLSRVDAVLLDLGLSSDQLAWSQRGFSFRAKARSICAITPSAAAPPPIL